ncbi:MAG: protein kinase [Verrucomicrobiae bacterium]|nr:protein kinase [Verrucomicrobiae bacterium]
MADTSLCSVCGSSLPPFADAHACPACLLGYGLRPIDEDLKAELIAITTPGDRAAYIHQTCSGKHALKARLFAWLASLGAPADSPEPFPLADDPDLEHACLGHYRLLTKLGEGGFGTVYLANQDRPVKRCVAVKILKSGMDSERVINRFETERQTLALMDHPNIAKIFDAGQTRSGRPFFVMELISGEPITTFSTRHRLGIRERLHLFIQACDGVQHAHQKGIIHRDLKPTNILVSTGDDHPILKIIDFGIAKATQPSLSDLSQPATTLHQFIGTPAYISPEHVLTGAKGVDTRSDIYSLGVLLYELLTGVTPFDQQELLRAGLEGMCRIIREREPVKPSLRLRGLAGDPDTPRRRPSFTSFPADLDWIVLKSLQKDRNLRYATANGLAMEIRRYLRGEPILARPPNAGYRAGKWIQRNPLVASLGLLLALALTVSAIVGTWVSIRVAHAKTETDRANQRLAQIVRRLEWEKAEEFVADNQRYRALLWFARVLRENPQDAEAAARVLSMLTLNNFALPAAPRLVHDGPVQSVRFNADASRVLTASVDGIACLWDTSSGHEIRRWTHSVEITKAEFACGERRLILESKEHFLRVLDAETGHLILERPGRREFPAGIVAGDDRTLFAFEDDATLTLWDLESGQPIGAPRTLPAAVRDADQSRAAGVVGVILLNREVWILDALEGRTMATLNDFTELPDRLAFAPDGHRIFIVVFNSQRLVAWPFRTAAKATVHSVPSPAQIEKITFTADGRRFASESYFDWPRLWNADTLEIVATAREGEKGRGGFRVSANDSVAASYSQFGMARVYEAHDLVPLLEPIDHQAPVSCLDLDPTGFRMVTGSQDGMARLWDLRMRAPSQLMLPPTVGRAVEAEFNSAGTCVLVSVRTDALRLCDSHTGESIGPDLELPRHLKEPHIWRASFSPNGDRILAAGLDGRIQIWDAATGRPVVDWIVPPDVMVARFSPDGRRVVTGDSEGFARIADSTTGSLVEAPCRGTGEVTSLAFDPRGARFASAHAGGTVLFWSLEDGRQLGPPLRHRGIVWGISFSPDGRHLVTASADRTARIWNPATGIPIAKPLRHEGEVLSSCFSPDGSRVLTTASDGSARVWDAATGDPVTPLMEHAQPTWIGRFSPDGRIVATGSLDRTARLWSAESGFPLTEPLRHPSGVLRVSFSPDGNRLLTFGGERARIWEVFPAPGPPPPWFVELIEAVAGFRWMPDGQIALAPTDIIARLRHHLVTDKGNDAYTRWARWFLVERMGPPAPVSAPATNRARDH